MVIKQRWFTLISCCLALGAVILAAATGNKLATYLYKKYMPPYAEPTLVFGPGNRFNIGDRVVQVYGFDKCPQDGALSAVFGIVPELKNSCIQLDKPEVQVVFSDHARETWTVKRDGGKTRLIRPNGFQVQSAEK